MKSIKDIESVASSHRCGRKKVLLCEDETATNLTQVAVLYLKAGEEGIAHRHWGIEEGFFVLKGELDLMLGSETIRMTVGDYMHMHMAELHNLRAITDVEMLTIGCKVNA